MRGHACTRLCIVESECRLLGLVGGAFAGLETTGSEAGRKRVDFGRFDSDFGFGVGVEIGRVVVVVWRGFGRLTPGSGGCCRRATAF